MAHLKNLPEEVLQEIIRKIPGRPFKTELLLINKTFCKLLMVEQVRSLNLSENQVYRWVSLTVNNTTKQRCRTLRYCDLIDRVYELTIRFQKEFPPKVLAGLISRCTNLHILTLQNDDLLRDTFYNNKVPWDIGSFLDSVHVSSNVIEIRLSGILMSSSEIFRFLTEDVNRNTKLAKLYLVGNEIDGRGIYALAESLKQNTTITTLHIIGNNIGSEGGCALAKYLEWNSTLIGLYLDACNMGSEGARTLAEHLRQNSTLKHLSLYENRIGSDGACALAECLRQNSAITQLYVGYNGIGDDGTSALAECLKHNSALMLLTLEDNNIGDKGACALAECLKQNTTLTHLWLRNNNIGEEGACALAKCLKQNLTFTQFSSSNDKRASALAEDMNLMILPQLDLSGNNINDKGACVLIEYLKHIHVKLKCNKFRNETITLLKQNTIFEL